jgi:AMP deaminase
MLHSQLDGKEDELADSMVRLNDLPNELSAPYEVPQFPIEQLEKKLFIQRQLSMR